MSTSKVFGIDLGTTYSCIAQVDRFGRPEVLSNLDSEPTTPSVVLFDGDDRRRRQAGQAPGPDQPRQRRPARQAAHGRPRRGASRRTARSGRPRRSRRSSSRRWPTTPTRQTGEPVDRRRHHRARLLRRRGAQGHQAGRRDAGLNVVDIINEPTAAAFAYGFARPAAPSETVLVYDLGGGTFDVTVIQPGRRRGSIRVVATDGDHELGGADWDARLADAPRRALPWPSAPTPRTRSTTSYGAPGPASRRPRRPSRP